MTNPSSYPAPAERVRIIRERNRLFEKLLPHLLTGKLDKERRPIRKLIEKHGEAEIDFILAQSQTSAEGHNLISEPARTYREYRRTFARFGGDRPFLSNRDYQRLKLEFNQRLKRRQIKSIIPFVGRTPGQREQELYDRLLLQVEYWEDITPPAVPPRPPEFSPPPANHYDSPVKALLERGWPEEDESGPSADGLSAWHSAMPELVKMVMDEGLLEGWPGERASWGPYHALHLLGQLPAADQAGRLLELLGRENDWLSDRLPVVWGQMGPAAEGPLQAYLTHRDRPARQRGSAMLGLQAIADRHPDRRGPIIKSLTERLQKASGADETANGYLVYVLNRMQATEARGAILGAYARKIIDETIIRAKEIPFLEE